MFLCMNVWTNSSLSEERIKLSELVNVVYKIQITGVGFLIRSTDWQLNRTKSLLEQLCMQDGSRYLLCGWEGIRYYTMSSGKAEE